MAERKVIIGSSGGLHARPAKLFVEAAGRQPVAVSISVGDRPAVPARSLLSVLSLGAVCGTEVTLHADDDAGAEPALDALATLLAQDLDGPDPAAPAGAGPGVGERAGA
jgi:phosphocarrier protein